MNLPDSFVDDLLARIDITDIIGSRIQLKKAGSNYQALCPFHSEKTPSFTVSPTKQFFHCFGCGANGSAIGFLMKYENLEFIDAVEILAKIANVEIPKSSYQKAETQYSQLYALMEKAATIFAQELKKSQSAIAYLKARGLTGEICKKFGIGFANAEWDNLSSLHHQDKIIKQQLQEVGLLLQKNNTFYSRFRQRIMFPIKNRTGKIIGFGGRTIANDPAKYINSPETPIYHKGNEIYGLSEAKKAQKNLTQIIVVEGYMDVTALAQYGVTNVVATSGTAITPKQVQQLLRQTSEIIFCFDGDTAGRSAAVRALENSLPYLGDGVQIKFLFIPDAEDPDSLIRHEGKEAFLSRINQAINLPDFLFNHLTSKINPNTIQGKSLFAKEAQKYFQKMPTGIFKQLLLTKLSEIINISIEELSTIENSRETFFPSLKPEPENIQAPSNKNLVKVILLLAHYPKLVEHIKNIDEISKIALPDIDLLVKLINFIKSQPNSSIGAILEYWRNNFSDAERIGAIITQEPIIKFNDEDLKNEFLGAITMLYNVQKEHQISSLLKKAANESLPIDEKRLLQQLIANTKNNIDL